MILNKCQLCNGKLKKIFSLGKQPLCDDLIKIGSKKKNKLYKTDIIFCEKCIIAYNKHLVDPKKLFPKTYHYRAKLTKDVTDGMENLVKDLQKKFGNLKNKVVVDIGCNDGALLDIFSKHKCITIGVEPTNACKKIKKHKIYNNFFSREVALDILKKFDKIDFIVFTNVFAHINNLNVLIKNIKTLSSHKTKIVIENHYLGSVIKKIQFDTFYHEHPRTYSLTSFAKISEKLDKKIYNFSFPKRYGGNIRVVFSNIENKLIKKKLRLELTNEKKLIKKFKKFKIEIDEWRVKTTKKLKKLKKLGYKFIGKAFPGRASIIINYLRLNKDDIIGIFEKPSSPKIGYYVPNTNIPILSDRNIIKHKDKIIINFAWHINKEIKRYLKKNKIQNKVFDII